MSLLKSQVRRLARWSWLDWAIIAAATVFVAGAAVRGASAARGGLRLEQTEPADIPVVSPLRNLLPHAAPELLMAAVVTDPFRADRTAPPTRYRLNEPNGLATDDDDASPAIPDYALHGIAVAGGLRMALIEGSSGQPHAQVYRPGDAIDDFRVKSVSGDSVVLVRGDTTTIILKIRRPWHQEKP